MIRLVCPGCGSKLNAKDELVGQVRKCPKCGGPVEIRASEVLPERSELAAEEGSAADVGLPVHHWLERLDRRCHYLIVDRARLVALWEDNGEGWMLKTRAGVVNAARNRELIPSQGEFQLVELKLQAGDAGRRLVGLTSYQLASRWALTSLERGDDRICEKITGPGCLNKDQKNAVRSAIKDQFMHEIWQDAHSVLDYLADTDYHSPGPE